MPARFVGPKAVPCCDSCECFKCRMTRREIDRIHAEGAVDVVDAITNPNLPAIVWKADEKVNLLTETLSQQTDVVEGLELLSGSRIKI